MSRILEASAEADENTDLNDAGFQEGQEDPDFDQIDAMSDEELMKYEPSPDTEKSKASPKAPAEEEGAKPDDEGTGADGDADEDDGDTEEEEKDPQESPKVEEKAEAKEGDKAEEPQDFESLYKKLMAPFKANGKMVEPKTPEELIRLAQMGANYTRKMQGLQPNLKLMRMLENNGLLDESKLSFLIDLDKKNPQAIQKFLRDGKIDPLEIDTETEPSYKPGNHSVSDQEMMFMDTLQEVASTEEGKQTVYQINKNWDQASKEVIYKEPELLRHLTDQRSSGIYGMIESEIEREKMLGNLKGVPFIQAYKTVGDRLQAEGKFASLVQPQRATADKNQDPQTRQALETRPASQTKPDPNGDRARAAAPSRRTPAKPQVTFDPFELSDEEIMAMKPPR